MELKRQKLVIECEEFTTIDAFRYIDQGGKGEITVDQLIRALKTDLDLDLDIDDMIMFFQKFDKAEQRVLKYSDFCDAFAPKEHQCLKELALRVPRNLQLALAFSEMFSEHARALYRDVWLEHLHCEKQTELLRQNLLKNPVFDLQKAFQSLDTLNHGYITVQDVSVMLVDVC